MGVPMVIVPDGHERLLKKRQGGSSIFPNPLYVTLWSVGLFFVLLVNVVQVQRFSAVGQNLDKAVSVRSLVFMNKSKSMHHLMFDDIVTETIFRGIQTQVDYSRFSYLLSQVTEAAALSSLEQDVFF